MKMNALDFYRNIKGELDRLNSYSIPLRIRIENSDGTLDSVADVKGVSLYDVLGSYGLQITLTKQEEI